MQEVEQEIGRQFVVVLKGAARLTPKLVAKAMKIAARPSKTIKKIKSRHNNKKVQKHGKMTVKELAAKDKGMTSIELHDQSFREFSRIAKKYGIDFAPFKVKGEKKFMIFFKAPDTDAMTACVEEYTKKQVKKAAREKRPSVLQKLKDIRAGITNPARTAERHKEPVLS